MPHTLKKKWKEFTHSLLPSTSERDRSNSRSRSPSPTPVPSRRSVSGTPSRQSPQSTSTPLAGSTVSQSAPVAFEPPTIMQPSTSSIAAAVASVSPSSVMPPSVSDKFEAPPIKSAPALRTDTNVPFMAMTTEALDTASPIVVPPSPQRTKLSQWWEVHRGGIMTSVIKVFEVTTKVLELVPLAEPAAKAFEHAASVLEEVQRSWENVDAVRDLTQQMERIIVALQRCEQPLPRAMQQRIDELRGELLRLAAAWKKDVTKSWFNRVINADSISQELASLGSQMNALIEMFKFESLLSVEPAVDTIRRIVFDVQKEQARVLAALSDKEISESNAVLDRLNPVKSAWYDSAGSPTGCLPGTRESLLRDIMAWFTSDGPPVYWLKGLAGTGKTTIARSVAELARERGSLGATFFFSRTDIARRNPLLVIPTLAYMLARWRLELRYLICAAVDMHTDIADHESVREQARCLLAEALSALSSPVPRVLIILDALDECDRLDGGDGGELLPALFDCLGALPVIAKILITSRDEPSIRSMFAKEQDGHPMQTLALHTEIEADVVNSDLYLYLTHELGHISKVTGGDALWPPHEVIKELVDRAGKLFVYAAAVVKYIKSGRLYHPLEDLLAEVLAAKLHEAGQRWPLDQLYSQILIKASSDMGLYTETHRVLVLETVASLVLLQEPLPMNVIARLADKPQALVNCLESVLWKSDDGTVRLFHPSFADFVADPKRCTNLSFPINDRTVTGVSFLVLPEEHHHRLARRCLVLMNTHLQYDICGLVKPWIPNVDIVDLQKILNRRVPHELRYACKFWAVHLAKAREPEITLLVELETFCREHLLHWLELLSLMEALSSVDDYLPGAFEWCQTHTIASGLWRVMSLLRDAVRLLRVFRIPIRSHALHVYHSAAVTMPHCALTRLAFLQPKGVPRLVSPRAKGWGPDVRVFEGHTERVMSVAFSTDGKQTVSGSADKTIRIWDAQTGIQFALLKGHAELVTSVAFSTDGKRIVSGSHDQTVRIWDAQTGVERALLEGHSGRVMSVAFSMDGNHIVSGSCDHTIRIWDTKIGIQCTLLEGHTHWVMSVAFSADGKKIVSASRDKSIRVWDTQTGVQRAMLLGHTDWVTSVAFSADSKHIVSGSCDNTIRVWDVLTGFQRKLLEGHTGWVTSVAFSTDSTQIVSGSCDETVRIWHAKTGVQRALFEGHTERVMSVAFSTDSKQIASASHDKTIRIWDAQTGVQSTLLGRGHTERVMSIAFSLDSMQIVSGSHDKTIHVLDAETGVQHAVLKGHTDWVTAVAFSMDGKKIVSGSHDQTARAWDVQLGMQIALFEGHTGWVSSVTFSPDSKHVVSGSYDQTVRVWDAQTGVQCALLKGHTDWVASVTFSTDGKHIVSTSHAADTLTWDCDTFTLGSGAEGALWHGVHARKEMAGNSSHAVRLSFQSDAAGWIVGNWLGQKEAPVPLCWLPIQRRGDVHVVSGSVMAVGATTGVITILDFSAMLAMLNHAGVRPM